MAASNAEIAGEEGLAGLASPPVALVNANSHSSSGGAGDGAEAAVPAPAPAAGALATSALSGVVDEDEYDADGSSNNNNDDDLNPAIVEQVKQDTIRVLELLEQKQGLQKIDLKMVR